ncbi:MAG: hypothetical protein JRG89_13335 [Deltaproteobacteria bacterium]|nr:hypothetical protein [Deltaproteobacteria bacterium]MBW2389405.1 hypothetical protein [Deltaproteobacteria bacterium]MBW2723423.1 hypothetical protein [Deltaproteobacteria bacterium]
MLGQAPGLQLEKLRRLLTERYTPGIWQGRELFLRREGKDWLTIEDMDPGPLVDTLEYDGEVEGLPYPVYGGLMTRRNVVYNRAFIGYSYRFVEDTIELFKGVSTAHLQVFLGEAWKECIDTHKNRLERHREVLFDDIRSRAKDWLAAAAQKSEALQLTSLALELEDYLAKMAKRGGEDAVAPAPPADADRKVGRAKPARTHARRPLMSSTTSPAFRASLPRPRPWISELNSGARPIRTIHPSAHSRHSSHAVWEIESARRFAEWAGAIPPCVRNTRIRVD